MIVGELSFDSFLFDKFGESFDLAVNVIPVSSVSTENGDSDGEF